LHPEQYSNTFSDAQIKQLHDAIMYVCKTAIELLGDSDKFPEDWLMNHRWGKGKKDGGTLPNGAKITFLKVGGRTSAVVPSVQKKTGAVAGDISEDTNGAEKAEELDVKPNRGSKRKNQAVKEEEDEIEESDKPTKSNTKRVRRKVGDTDVKEEEKVKDVALTKRKGVTSGSKPRGQSVKGEVKSDGAARRRSSRLSGV
jgi:formamidopyrimidine-DNA glycosylase